AVGCWLLAVGCWLLAVGCWLLAVKRTKKRLFELVTKTNIFFEIKLQPSKPIDQKPKRSAQNAKYFT
ncbi:MAG: hypothetical protein P8P77_06535, partial [Crocinitomicaceae bacterium]|nr:hypothetical protein [Crocinitomicaceae bacterium]